MIQFKIRYWIFLKVYQRRNLNIVNFLMTGLLENRRYILQEGGFLLGDYYRTNIRLLGCSGKGLLIFYCFRGCLGLKGRRKLKGFAFS